MQPCRSGFGNRQRRLARWATSHVVFTPLRFACWCLLCTSQLPLGGAIHRKIDLQYKGHSWAFLEMNLGLEPGARFDIDILNHDSFSHLYLVVMTDEQWQDWRRFSAQQDVPAYSSPLGGAGDGPFTGYVACTWRAPLQGHLQTSFELKGPAPKDLYHIGILNTAERDISLEGTLDVSNPGTELQVQEINVPPVLVLVAGLFLASAIVYAVLILIGGRRYRTEMHGLMGGTILLKALVLTMRWADYRQMAATGMNSLISQVGWQLLDKVQDILELNLLLFISLGWKFLRPNLNPAEKRFAVGIAVISFYLGLFEVACTSQASCNGHTLSRYMLHSLVYLVIIVAMNFNLQLIGAQIHEAPATLEAGKLYKKFLAYRAFRWIVLAFVVAPTLEMILKLTVLPWDAAWLFILLQQLRTWVIYVCIVVAFAPLPQPTALRVFDLTRDGDESEGEAEEDGVVETEFEELRMSIIPAINIPPPPPLRRPQEPGSVEIIRGFPR